MFSNPSQSNAQILICQKKGTSLSHLPQTEQSLRQRHVSAQVSKPCQVTTQHCSFPEGSKNLSPTGPQMVLAPQGMPNWENCSLENLEECLYWEKKIMVVGHPSFLKKQPGMSLLLDQTFQQDWNSKPVEIHQGVRRLVGPDRGLAVGGMWGDRATLQSCCFPSLWPF